MTAKSVGGEAIFQAITNLFTECVAMSQFRIVIPSADCAKTLCSCFDEAQRER
jgi:hypothetical protein